MAPEQNGGETFELQPDQERARIGQWLIEIQAIREGREKAVCICDPDTGSEITVTLENFIAIETCIRNTFSGRYPDLAIIDAEAVEIRGELNPGPSVSE